MFRTASDDSAATVHWDAADAACVSADAASAVIEAMRQNKRRRDESAAVTIIGFLLLQG
jgi:hypothetical protein